MVEPGAALVSVLELSDPGEVIDVEVAGAVTSLLLDSVVVDELGVADALGAVDVSVPLAEEAGAVTVLVVASLAGAELLLLHPAKTRGRAASAIRVVTNMDDIFMILFR